MTNTNTITRYHATRKPLDLADRAICVTDDRDASIEYLEGERGTVYTLTVPRGLRIADADDLREIADEIDPEHGYYWPWELLEDVPGVRAVIEARYDGVCYDDRTPDNRTGHETLVIFRPVSVGVEIAAAVAYAADDAPGWAIGP